MGRGPDRRALAAVLTQHPIPARSGGRVVAGTPRNVVRMSPVRVATDGARAAPRVFGPDGGPLAAGGTTVV
jgi:hypothetical protein